MSITNMEIRTAKGFIPWWKIADKMGIAEVTLVKWMRKELEPEKKERILDAIKQIKQEL